MVTATKRTFMHDACTVISRFPSQFFSSGLQFVYAPRGTKENRYIAPGYIVPTMHTAIVYPVPSPEESEHRYQIERYEKCERAKISHNAKA